MFKKIFVKKHFRKGTPVAAHERLIVDLYDENWEERSDGVSLGVSALAKSSDTEHTVSGRNFQGCSFDGAAGFKAPRRYENCVFDGSIFSQANLNGVEFIGCTFVKSRIQAGDLSNAKFKDCSFEETYISGKQSRVPWVDTIFEGCKFIDSRFGRVSMELGGFTNCSFYNVDVFNYSVFKDVKILKSTLSKVSIRGSSGLPGTLFDECILEDVRLVDIGNYVRDENGKDFIGIGESKVGIHRSSMRNCSFDFGEMNGSSIVNSSLENCSFLQMDLTDMNFYGCQGANLEFDSSNFKKSKFENNTFKNVNIAESVFPEVFWKNNIVDCEFSKENSGNSPGSFYQQYSFEEALEESGLSRERFEFLVLSGVIEVRDNETLQKVTSGFDTEKHHVPPWVYGSFDRIISPVVKKR